VQIFFHDPARVVPERMERAGAPRAGHVSGPAHVPEAALIGTIDPGADAVARALAALAR